ncbi:MAG: VWA domain-containing protein [Clostridia bacterium]|nr:VWA domain-containing protein [Clostridia bacterium]
MVFNFNQPLFLLLIPAAILFVILASRTMVKLVQWRRRSIIALRVCIFLLLALCIAGFGLKKTSDSVTTVFVVDSSASASKMKEKAEDFIANSIKSKKSSDKIGIVCFGANAAVELTPTQKPYFPGIQTSVNSNFTNIEQALKLAESLIPSADRKRMVLLTDGLENDGDAVKQSKLLKQKNITLDVYPLSLEQGSEVQVKELSVPKALRMNEKFDMNVRIDSTVKTRAVLKLYADRQLAAEKEVELQAGENNFVFSDTADRGGMIIYSAFLEPENDTIIKNNSVSAFTNVEDTASILVVQDRDEAASELVKMLGTDIKVNAVNPDNVPLSMEELQKYDAFIISNTPAEKLDDKFLNNLELCIRLQGKGLLVTGGENSYAPGGYYKTPLEKVLPVNMDIKPKKEHPNLGLLLVIDKSGSMSTGQYGISKLELAKEAAIRSTEALKKDDIIGVIAFDDAVQWVVRPQKLENLQAIQDAIASIRPGGGTQILHPLDEAYKALKSADAKLKHIILLTDGQAERSGYEPIVDGINEAGITLSTVAVGRESDRALLEALAIGGNGRFYMTDAFSDIPKIFVKETFLAGKTYLNNRTFTPILTAYSDMLKNIKAVPVLDGYVGTSPKSTARVIFSSDRDEPILASWQYGLGRTVAWTSDVKGMWTADWLQWEQAATFWKNILSWIIQRKMDESYSIKGSMSGGSGTVELTLPAEERLEKESVEAVMISPSGTEESITLSPVSPGIYRGKFNAEATGVYVASVSIKSGSEALKTINTGINIPYSPEYDIPRSDASALLEKLAHEGGGRILKDAGDVFSGKLAPIETVTDMTPYLLPMVILLFMLDIALRRLNISLRRFEPAIRRAADAVAPIKEAVTRPAARFVKSISQRPKIEPERQVEKKQKPKAQEPQKKEADQASHVSHLLEKKKRREK